MRFKLLMIFEALLLPLSLYATYYDVEQNGIYYKLKSSTKEASVTGCVQIYDEYEEQDEIRVQGYEGDVVIPESIIFNGIKYAVTSIEGYSGGEGLDGRDERHGAFYRCGNLNSITIPSSITKIGSGAFDGCSSMKAVYISDLSAWCKIEFGIGCFSGREEDDCWYDDETNPLSSAHDLYLNGIKIVDLIIPDDIYKISRGTFTGGSFESVVFHNKVTEIGPSSFKDCDNLENVFSYSSNINVIDRIKRVDGVFPAFSDCSKKTLHISQKHKDCYPKSPWNEFGKIEYFDYTLTYIVDNVVYQTSYYEEGEVITPAKYPSKQGYSFSGWSEIPDKMPNHDVTITGTFSPNTYKLTYKVDGVEYKVCEVNFDTEVVPEPEPTKKGMTFSGWRNIPKKMPAGDVTVTGTFSWSKITKNGVIYQVYNAENELAEVLGNDNASGEVKIISPVEVGGYNFSVTDIVDYSFKNNTDITSVVIPESVRAIGDEAFYGCKNITSIELGKSVNQIESRAFANIDKLTDVIVNADNVPKTDRTAFENSYIEGYVTLHVPIGCLDAYKAVNPWKAFMTIWEKVDAKIKLSKTKVTIQEGKTLTLIATITPSDLPDKSVTWESSNKKVATVTSGGKVKGVKAGIATITCTSKATGAKATCKVTIVEGGVKLNKTKANILKGKTLTLTATVTPSTLSDKSVTWKSSDTKVATVSSKGKVKGVKAGTATITCTSNATGLKATCTVTVVKGIVTLNKTEACVEKGKTMTLKATITPETLTDKSVTWKSSDTKIATVTSAGKVKGVKTGTATITCTSVATGAKATCHVTVGKVIIGTSEFSLKKSRTNMLYATVYPSTLTDKSVTWKSSNTSIATVTAEGKVKGIKAGTATITCTSVATGLKGTCTVTVLSNSEARSMIGDDDELTGIKELESPAVTEPFDVYDLSGRKVLHQVTSLDGLPDGIYIVNGKKILKKK